MIQCLCKIFDINTFFIIHLQRCFLMEPDKLQLFMIVIYKCLLRLFILKT